MDDLLVIIIMEQQHWLEEARSHIEDNKDEDSDQDENFGDDDDFTSFESS